MSEELREALLSLSKEFWVKAKVIEADPFGGGQLAIADIGRAIAYRDASRQLRTLVDGVEADVRAELGEDWNAPAEACR